MNVQLNGTEEFIKGKSTGTLGQVLIRYATNHVCGWVGEKLGQRMGALAEMRLTSDSVDRCNNVLWISAAKGVEMSGDVKMQE
jgi:small nuclear ribonucleoprotein F